MAVLQAQKGKQFNFLQQDVDIAFYGGSAGGGKTFALLLNALRHYKTKYYNSVIFRKNITHINKAGGLYDASYRVYKDFGARAVRHYNTFYFDNFDSKIQLAHLERDDDCYNYDGTEICLICFDELTHFSQFQFFYMLSRNRSTCGIKPRVRATCNPDCESWVREFISWYIDDKGYAIEDRCGTVRYFVNDSDQIHWFESRKNAFKKFPKIKAKSFTFINSNVYDNKVLLKTNPDYVSNLQALNRVEKERLLNGNWNVKLEAGDFFKRINFQKVDTYPKFEKVARAWDFAQTAPSESNKDPDYTVGVKMGVDYQGVYYVIDIVRVRENAGDIEHIYKNITSQDGLDCFSRIPRDPGGMTDMAINNLIKENRGYPINIQPVSKKKEARASGVASQVVIRNVKLLRAGWNEAFLIELESFPFGAHDDQVDAFGDAFKELLDMRDPIRVIRKPWER